VFILSRAALRLAAVQQNNTRRERQRCRERLTTSRIVFTTFKAALRAAPRLPTHSTFTQACH